MTKKTKSNTKKNTGLKKIKELEEIIDESKDKYLRLAAEYDNYRKRSLEEKLDATDNGKKNNFKISYSNFR